MIKARKFVQPMEHTGLPNTPGWAGYDYLQWTGSVHHPGLDYNWGAGEQDKGKPVFAIASGLVEKCIYWNGKSRGFGNHIFIKHILESSNKIIYSHYCHLNTIVVEDGQEVNIGRKIGTCGGSGGWPSHLHLEIRKPLSKGYNFWPKGYTAEWIDNNYFDPYKFIEDRKENFMVNSNDLQKCLEQHDHLMNVIKKKDKTISSQAGELTKYKKDEKILIDKLETANDRLIKAEELKSNWHEKYKIEKKNLKSCKIDRGVFQTKITKMKENSLISANRKTLWLELIKDYLGKREVVVKDETKTNK